MKQSFIFLFSISLNIKCVNTFKYNSDLQDNLKLQKTTSNVIPITFIQTKKRAKLWMKERTSYLILYQLSLDKTSQVEICWNAPSNPA